MVSADDVLAEIRAKIDRHPGNDLEHRVLGDDQSDIIGVDLFYDKSVDDELLWRMARCPRLASLETITFPNSSISDAGSRALLAFPKLWYVQLCGTRITDEAMKEIAKLTGLKVLRLDETDVGDTGVQEICRLALLHGLELAQTRITDECFRWLCELPSLNNLAVQGCNVTDRGAIWLKKAPKLKTVNFGWTKVTPDCAAVLRQTIAHVFIGGEGELSRTHTD